MEPSAGTPNFNTAPRPGNNVESGGNQLPQYNIDPGTTIDSSPNNLNQAPMGHEQLASAEELALPSQAMTVNPVAQTTQSTTTTSTTTPVDPVVVDAEKFNRVWVDKTKQTISATETDPYEQAHQIAQLMQGYLKERYGKIINSK